MAEFVYLLEHLALKTFCESVVESVGSVLKRHMQGRSPGHDTACKEAFLDWNGPPLHHAAPFLERVLAAGHEYTTRGEDKSAPWKFRRVSSRGDMLRAYARGPGKKSAK